MTTSTEQQYLWTGTIAGRKFKFDSLSGLGIAAQLSKFRPGGLGDEEVLRVKGSFQDITVTKSYDVDVVQEALRYFLNPSVAGTADMQVTEQPLDPVGNPRGKALTAKGVFQSVDTGSGDSQSANARMLNFTMSVEQVA